ncbi:MAG: DsbC family protein [Marinobacterium sp.]|nr:DsbC family protein [Marinobacterium sp.]
MRKVLVTALMTLGLNGALISSTAMAAEGAEQRIAAQLKKVNSEIPIESVKPASMQGLYEVTLGSGETLFSDERGEYFVVGQLYRYSDQDGFVNLTEQKLALSRAEKIAAIADDDKIVYAPQGEVKATINVFTDTSCPYCRKLHSEIPALNEMGVQVNYLAYPRAGFGSPAYKEMQSIWCQSSGKARADAMHASKSGGDKVAAKNCDNPIMDQMALGQAVGVNGTPAIVLEDGTLIPGYVPANRLAAMMQLK